MTTDVLTLIQVTKIRKPDGGSIVKTKRRCVFAERRSVGMRETYQASIAGLKPELAFVLEDELDYQGEELAEYNKVRYRVHRSARPPGSTEIKLVLTREVNKNERS